MYKSAKFGLVLTVTYLQIYTLLNSFELLLCTSLLDCRPAPQPIEPLKSSIDWVSSGVLNPLFNGSGFKFEDNSTELFSRVTVM